MRDSVWALLALAVAGETPVLGVDGAPQGKSNKAGATLAGTLVAYKGGAEIGRETYQDDGAVLKSAIVLAGQKIDLVLPHGTGKVWARCSGQEVQREIGPAQVALENGSWQSYAVTRAAVPAQGIEVRPADLAPPRAPVRAVPAGVTEEPFALPAPGRTRSSCSSRG